MDDSFGRWSSLARGGDSASFTVVVAAVAATKDVAAVTTLVRPKYALTSSDAWPQCETAGISKDEIVPIGRLLYSWTRYSVTFVIIIFFWSPLRIACGMATTDVK